MNYIQRVAVKAVITDTNNRVLILRKSQDDARHANKSGLYNLPGGKIKPGEPLETGLVREVEEEIGIKISEIGQPIFAGEWWPEFKTPMQIVGIFYSCKIPHQNLTLNDEHDRAAWITKDEIAQYPLLPPEDKAIEAYFNSL